MEEPKEEQKEEVLENAAGVLQLFAACGYIFLTYVVLTSGVYAVGGWFTYLVGLKFMSMKAAQIPGLVLTVLAALWVFRKANERAVDGD